jgi:undecaprenyl diphosphate synthase
MLEGTETTANEPDGGQTRLNSIPPQHVAIIMDGNGRWAEQHGLPRLKGHLAGTQNIRPVLKVLSANGVKYVTLFAFSTENWNRPGSEVEGLFQILWELIEHGEVLELHKLNIRLRYLGRMNRLSPKLRSAIKQALEVTRANTGLTLNIALNYGGRGEIVDAVREIVSRAIPADKIDETAVSEYLYTAGLPDPDLIIRTGGEMRISNFLLWQSAYSELYFTPTLWPDFSKDEIEMALLAYGQRQRRFGGLSSSGAESQETETAHTTGFVSARSEGPKSRRVGTSA